MQLFPFTKPRIHKYIKISTEYRTGDWCFLDANLRCNSLGAAPMERIESPRFLPPPLLDPSGWSIFIGGNELTAPCIRGTFHSGEGKFGERRKGKRTKPRCCIRNWIKRDKDNAMLENRPKRSKNRTEIRVKFEEFSRERVGKSCEFIRWMDVSLSFTDVYGKYTSGKGATRIAASWH